MWKQHCIQLLILGLTSVNASPALFYNTGFGDSAPSEVGCSYFTKVYDPYTGHFTYRCNPDVKKNNYISIPNVQNSDTDSNEDDSITRETLHSSGRSGTTYSKPTYQSFTSGRSQKKKKNNKPKRPTNSRRNRCPPGQIFQSELDICIDYPLGPPLPPRRPSNTRQTMFNHMLGDAPARAVAVERQRAPAIGTILSVRKYDIKNRCKPNEILVSELDICLPRNNCFPYGRTC